MQYIAETTTTGDRASAIRPPLCRFGDGSEQRTALRDVPEHSWDQKDRPSATVQRMSGALKCSVNLGKTAASLTAPHSQVFVCRKGMNCMEFKNEKFLLSENYRLP